MLSVNMLCYLSLFLVSFSILSFTLAPSSPIRSEEQLLVTFTKAKVQRKIGTTKRFLMKSQKKFLRCGKKCVSLQLNSNKERKQYKYDGIDRIIRVPLRHALSKQYALGGWAPHRVFQETGNGTVTLLYHAGNRRHAWRGRGCFRGRWLPDQRWGVPSSKGNCCRMMTHWHKRAAAKLHQVYPHKPTFPPHFLHFVEREYVRQSPKY